MTNFSPTFHLSPDNQPHPQRCREMLKKHPEIAQLMGRNPYTALLLLFVVALQFGLAWQLGQLGASYWYLSVVLAFCVGAFSSHSLYVMIHEATHNLIFSSQWLNRILGIVADLPNVMPSAMGFRIYHLKHHAHQGDPNYDADMASEWEARLVKNVWWRKALWLFFFPLFQVARPPRLNIRLWNVWTVANLLLVLLADIIVLRFLGVNGFLYLLLSFMFSVGLHPLGARWIQEHFTPDGQQETFSYYGPLNLLALNVGFHNEHHDFPAVPWNRLPQVRKIAPEYYNNLEYHTSWSKLLLKFIFDPSYSLFSRVERTKDGKVGYSPTREKQLTLTSS